MSLARSSRADSAKYNGYVMINFIKDIWHILSGKWAVEYELFNGPVTSEKLERQREYLSKIEFK